MGMRKLPGHESSDASLLIVPLLMIGAASLAYSFWLMFYA